MCGVNIPWSGREGFMYAADSVSTRPEHSNMNAIMLEFRQGRLIYIVHHHVIYHVGFVLLNHTLNCCILLLSPVVTLYLYMCYIRFVNSKAMEAKSGRHFSNIYQTTL